MNIVKLTNWWNQSISSAESFWGDHMTCLFCACGNPQTSTNSWLWSALLALFLFFNSYHHLPTSLWPSFGGIYHLYLISTAESWGTYGVCPVLVWVFIESAVKTDFSPLALEGLIEPCESAWPPDFGGSPLTLKPWGADLALWECMTPWFGGLSSHPQTLRGQFGFWECMTPWLRGLSSHPHHWFIVWGANWAFEIVWALD